MAFIIFNSIIISSGCPYAHSTEEYDNINICTSSEVFSIKNF